KNADLKAAQNLVIARSEFLPFSMAVAEFTQALRGHGGSVAAKVYKCPMYPQPGKTAYWIQSQGPLHNPFFGYEMLDCGQGVNWIHYQSPYRMVAAQSVPGLLRRGVHYRIWHLVDL